VKLIVRLPDGCPIGAKRERRTIGTFALLARGTAPLHSYELPETSVEVNSGSSLIVQASYVPANYSLSVIVRYRTASEDMHVLAAVAECSCIPVSLICRLPTGQYVEVYLQHEMTAANL
jgi:hypothetical protein